MNQTNGHKPLTKAQRERRVKTIKACAHEARITILDIFATPVDPEAEKLEYPLVSPKELAAEIRLPLPNVSYHVKILRELQMIELKRTTPRRGAVEHHYRLRPQVVPELDRVLR